MHLPKIETPKYNLVIPSTKKKLSFRPFLVKEEKILLLAQQSDNEEDQLEAVKSIIESCTFDKIKADDLTSYDIEYLFLQLRAKSVGESADVNIKCSKCGSSTPVNINLAEIDIKYPNKKIDNRIQLTDAIGVVVKNLSTADITKLGKLGDDQVQLLNDTIAATIESVFDADNVYPMDDASPTEKEEFINSLSRGQMEKIEEFISNVPKLQEEVTFKCLSCGEKNKIMLEGLQSFFN